MFLNASAPAAPASQCWVHSVYHHIWPNPDNELGVVESLWVPVQSVLHSKFQVNQGFIVRPCFKRRTKGKKEGDEGRKETVDPVTITLSLIIKQWQLELPHGLSMSPELSSGLWRCLYSCHAPGLMLGCDDPCPSSFPGSPILGGPSAAPSDNLRVVSVPALLFVLWVKW